MSIFNVMIKGHTLEFRSSCSGSIDPWTMDYAAEHKIPLFGTDDIEDFVKVDNLWIYKLAYCCAEKFIELYSNEKMQTWEEVQDWLNNNCKLIKNVNDIEKIGREG